MPEETQDQKPTLEEAKEMFNATSQPPSITDAVVGSVQLTSVKPTSSTALSTATPLGRGHEEPSDMEDIELPRAKLVQFTSEEAQAENKADRKDPGSMINSITKDTLDLSFVPIFKFTTFTKWNARKKDDPNYDETFEPGAMIFTTTDNRDPRVVEGTRFGPNGEPPPVTKYLNFLCLFTGSSMPLVLSFSKTSFSAGKRLNALTQFSGGDMFSKKYKLSVSIKENAGTKYYVLDVTPGGVPTDTEFKTCEKWYQDFRGKSLKVHTEADPKFTD